MGSLGKISAKLRFQQGQHLVEYGILMTLVMIGIITMSRYVIRSWNANLKGWDDSVIDSAEDPLEHIGFELLGCNIPDWQDVICEGSTRDECTGSPSPACPVRNMLQSRTFSPAGCECALSPPLPPLQCVVHSCCCDAPTVTPGACGPLATVISTDPLPDCNNVSMIPKYPDGSCPPGYQEAYTLCGADTAPIKRWGCLETAECNTQCLGQPPPRKIEYDSYCAGDDTPPFGLSVFTSYVDQNQCTAAYCEFQCAPPYVAILGGAACGNCEAPGATRCNNPSYTRTQGQPDTFAFDLRPSPQGDSCSATEWVPCCN